MNKKFHFGSQTYIQKWKKESFPTIFHHVDIEEKYNNYKEAKKKLNEYKNNQTSIKRYSKKNKNKKNSSQRERIPRANLFKTSKEIENEKVFANLKTRQDFEQLRGKNMTKEKKKEFQHRVTFVGGVIRKPITYEKYVTKELNTFPRQLRTVSGYMGTIPKSKNIKLSKF